MSCSEWAGKCSAPQVAKPIFRGTFTHAYSVFYTCVYKRCSKPAALGDGVSLFVDRRHACLTSRTPPSPRVT